MLCLTDSEIKEIGYFEFRKITSVVVRLIIRKVVGVSSEYEERDCWLYLKKREGNPAGSGRHDN